MLLISLLSRAEPNWAAPAYVSAIVLVVACMLARGWRHWVGVSVALNLAAAVALFARPTRSRRSGSRCPLNTIRCTVARLARARARRRDAARGAPGLTLLADDRELLAALIYYVRPTPFGAVEWNPVPGVTDQWRLVNNIGSTTVRISSPSPCMGLAEEMRPILPS